MTRELQWTMDNPMIKLLESGVTSLRAQRFAFPCSGRTKVGWPTKSASYPRRRHCNGIGDSLETITMDKVSMIFNLPTVFVMRKIIGVSDLSVPRSSLPVGQYLEIIIGDEAEQ